MKQFTITCLLSMALMQTTCDSGIRRAFNLLNPMMYLLLTTDYEFLWDKLYWFVGIQYIVPSDSLVSGMEKLTKIGLPAMNRTTRVTTAGICQSRTYKSEGKNCLLRDRGELAGLLLALAIEISSVETSSLDRVFSVGSISSEAIRTQVSMVLS